MGEEAGGEERMSRKDGAIGRFSCSLHLRGAAGTSIWTTLSLTNGKFFPHDLVNDLELKLISFFFRKEIIISLGHKIGVKAPAI